MYCGRCYMIDLALLSTCRTFCRIIRAKLDNLSGNKPMKRDDKTAIRCKQPIKIEKPLLKHDVRTAVVASLVEEIVSRCHFHRTAQIMAESTENNKQFANSSSPQIEEEELQKLEKLSM